MASNIKTQGLATEEDPTPVATASFTKDDPPKVPRPLTRLDVDQTPSTASLSNWRPASAINFVSPSMSQRNITSNKRSAHDRGSPTTSQDGKAPRRQSDFSTPSKDPKGIDYPSFSPGGPDYASPETQTDDSGLSAPPMTSSGLAEGISDCRNCMGRHISARSNATDQSTAVSSAKSSKPVAVGRSTSRKQSASSDQNSITWKQTATDDRRLRNLRTSDAECIRFVKAILKACVSTKLTPYVTTDKFDEHNWMQWLKSAKGLVVQAIQEDPIGCEQMVWMFLDEIFSVHEYGISVGAKRRIDNEWHGLLLQVKCSERIKKVIATIEEWASIALDVLKEVRHDIVAAHPEFAAMLNRARDKAALINKSKERPESHEGASSKPQRRGIGSRSEPLEVKHGDAEKD
ncbi:hypothetical protein Slin14017_G066990 [Septoria linicola]|nr:hypothetical protein Slin14017_G066990 [Septoria linicola]